MKKPTHILQQLLKDIKKSKQKTDGDISIDAKNISPAQKAKLRLCWPSRKRRQFASPAGVQFQPVDALVR